jgi:alcohol dehydrogenase YqhD (iron-dependent ADH family)
LVATVPTNPASGSESSEVTVINDPPSRTKLMVSDPLVRPELALMNPSLTVSLPAFPTACGLVDVFSHVCERYFSPDHQFGVVDSMAEGLLSALVSLGPKCLADPTNIAYRAEIMWAAAVAQNGFFGVGRVQDWATHIMANEISALYDTPHGATLSILMPSWMRCVLDANSERFARYAARVFGVEGANTNQTAVQGIDRTEQFFRQLGLPTSFEDLGLPQDGIEHLLDAITFSGPNQTIGGLRQLDRGDCRRIYQAAL